MAGKTITQRWTAQSETDPSKTYTVALYSDGTYGCACPVWKFRRQQCKHIQDVQAGAYDAQSGPDGASIELALANTRQVHWDAQTGNGRERVMVPLVPPGNLQFVATVIYDLLQLGLPWRSLGTYTQMIKPADGSPLQPGDIKAYIRANGRLIYGPWNALTGRHDGYVLEGAPVVEAQAA